VQLDTALPWLALCLTRGIAARPSARLLNQFGSPENVSARCCGNCKRANSLPRPHRPSAKKRHSSARKRLCGYSSDSRLPTGELERPEYPQTPLQICDPPVFLYVRGIAQILNAPSLAVVGTRRSTLYGTRMADRLARDLAARVIDASAHQGAMTNGRAIGVPGTVVDVC
jgi:DNA processing protein